MPDNESENKGGHSSNLEHLEKVIDLKNEVGRLEKENSELKNVIDALHVRPLDVLRSLGVEPSLFATGEQQSEDILEKQSHLLAEKVARKLKDYSQESEVSQEEYAKILENLREHVGGEKSFPAIALADLWHDLFNLAVKVEELTGQEVNLEELAQEVEEEALNLLLEHNEKIESLISQKASEGKINEKMAERINQKKGKSLKNSMGTSGKRGINPNHSLMTVLQQASK